MLDLRRLRLLKEFAGRGTIAATAAALGYTPSAVSQQLAALEREAGVILLDRTARSAELTDAGRRLAVHAERILAQVEEAEAELSAAEREPSGRVSVAAFPTAAAAFAPALARSLRAHPALTLLLRQTQRDEGLNSVRWGEADVALVDDWTGRVADRGAGCSEFYPLVRDPLVLVVPRGHPLADPAEPVDLRKLSQTSRWMAAPAGEASRQATDQLLAAAGGAPAMPVGVRGAGHHPVAGLPGHRRRRGAPAGPGRRRGPGSSANCPARTWPATCTRWPGRPACAAPGWPWRWPPCTTAPVTWLPTRTAPAVAARRRPADAPAPEVLVSAAIATSWEVRVTALRRGRVAASARRDRDLAGGPKSPRNSGRALPGSRRAGRGEKGESSTPSRAEWASYPQAGKAGGGAVPGTEVPVMTRVLAAACGDLLDRQDGATSRAQA